MATWPPGNEKAERAVTLSRGRLVNTDDTKFSETYFHDLTPYSRGLLTDVKNGGLKRDLTLAFEDEEVFTRWFGRVKKIDSRGSNPKVSTEGGYTESGSKEKFFISDAFWRQSGREVGSNWGTMCHYYNLQEKTGQEFFDIVYPHPLRCFRRRCRSDWKPV